MLARAVCYLTLLVAACFSISCSQKPTGRAIKKLPVVEVTGVVTVDGQPAEGVAIRCIPQGADAESRVSVLKDAVSAFRAVTKDDGTFSLRTYEEGDGLPAGEYVITFAWPAPYEGMQKRSSREIEASDRLQGKYTKPENWVKFNVIAGSPLELEPFKLTTK